MAIYCYTILSCHHFEIEYTITTQSIFKSGTKQDLSNNTLIKYSNLLNHSPLILFGVHTLRTMPPRIVFICAGFGQRPRLRGVQPPQLRQGGQESTSHLTTRVCRHVETGSLPFLWKVCKIIYLPCRLYQGILSRIYSTPLFCIEVGIKMFFI